MDPAGTVFIVGKDNSGNTLTASPPNEDIQVRERMNTLAQALHAKDIDALMSHYAPDVVTFDFRPPLRVLGADAYRKNFEAWFASVQGPINYEVYDLRITMTEPVAFCHYLGHVKSTGMNGENTDYWVRVTSGLRRTSDQWMIIHEHVSAPIDMETMQASLDLQP